MKDLNPRIKIRGNSRGEPRYFFKSREGDSGEFETLEACEAALFQHVEMCKLTGIGWRSAVKLAATERGEHYAY